MVSMRINFINMEDILFQMFLPLSSPVSLMISIRRINFTDVEDILFQMFLPMFSQCSSLFIIVLPLSSLFLPMSLLMRRINSIWRIFYYFVKVYATCSGILSNAE